MAIRIKRLAGLVTSCALATSSPVLAQVYQRGTALPLELAAQAAMASVSKCEGFGFPVSVAVVDPSGQMRVFVKADHATVHTKDASFRKAYTAVTFAPIFHFGRSSEFAEKLKSNPNGAAFSGIPDILPLPGAVTVERAGEVVAAIGVSGSPDGLKDEACAQAGLEAIRPRL